MKLLTTIPARRDGTLSVTGADGAVYDGIKNAFGDIEFDIPCELTVASLLAGGKFYPADEDDFDAAETLLSGGEDGGEDDDADEDDDVDNGAASEALPVEANTPPSTAKPKNAGKKK